MSESTELVAWDDPQFPARSPADIKAWDEKVREMKRAVLVAGVDYMAIPGSPKPSLLQAGADKMAMLAGLTYTLEIIDQEPKQNVTYKCRVYRGGQPVAECDGYAGLDETTRKGTPQWHNWNSVMKMAQKRAKVGAISSALALGGLFTQDVEDSQPVNVVGLIQPFLDQLDEDGRQELKEWRAECKLPAPSAMTLEQAAGVLVHIGLIAGRFPRTP